MIKQNCIIKGLKKPKTKFIRPKTDSCEIEKQM